MHQIRILTIIFTLFVLGCCLLCAQEGQPSVEAIIAETQQQTTKASDMTMVWWIPTEFWQISLSQDKTLAAEDVQEFVNVLQPYTLIAVVKGKIGPMGGTTFLPEADVRATVQIRDTKGRVYKPLAANQINADVTNLLSMMKPMFANLFGPLGQNLHFVCFPGKTAEGERIADPKKDGRLSVVLADETFKWRLPLGSLLPPKKCPVCGETVSGAYKYCPWDATKLP